MSSFLWPHGLQHSSLLCPLISPGVCSNSCPLTQWRYLTTHPFLPLLLLASVFPSIRVSSNKLAVCIRWSKYWSFIINPSSEYSGLISFRINWFDLLAVQGTLKSLLQHPSLWRLQFCAFDVVSQLSEALFLVFILRDFFLLHDFRWCLLLCSQVNCSFLLQCIIFWLIFFSSLWLAFSCFFVCLVVFDWMPNMLDIIAFF